MDDVKTEDLRPLIYPLVQIATGVIKCVTYMSKFETNLNSLHIVQAYLSPPILRFSFARYPVPNTPDKARAYLHPPRPSPSADSYRNVGSHQVQGLHFAAVGL